MVFSLCTRVGWCDACTDFTKLIKVEVDVNLPAVNYLNNMLDCFNSPNYFDWNV